MPSVRFIDPLFTRANPSTNGLVDVAEELAARGWDVEVFSHALEPRLAGRVTHRKLREVRLPFRLSAWAYFFIYHWHGLVDLLMRRPRAQTTVSTGFMYLPADLATVHFSHFDFYKSLWLHGRNTQGLARAAVLGAPGILTELLFLWNPWKTRLLAVSSTVVDDMAAYAAPWKNISLLPNQAIHDRFFPAYREENRGKARNEHGFAENETVLLFASAGHHFRKGFLHAVDAISLLRKRGLTVRMLVIGGGEATLRRVQKQVRRDHPDFADWIVFTGAVTNPEYHFAAADALFFPSLSEAFSLVEIEAAALGLPLYLTAHHGSEMILRDGRNGRLLPWDVPGMADVLEDEIRSGRMRFTDGSTGRALSKDEYLEEWMRQLAPDNRQTAPVAPSGKPKLMLIGHTYMVSVNREKAVHLAAHFEVRVCTCESKGWMVLGSEVVDSNPPAHEASYQLRRLTRWPRWQDYTKIAFRGLQAEMADFRPDVVLVENEPWSLLRWQARVASWIAAPKARFAEFTWENVERPGIRGRILKLVYTAASVTGDRLICGNAKARDICVAAGFPAGETIVAPQLGIGLEDHPPASPAEREAWRTSLGWPRHSKVLGFCGRLVEEKGLIELAEATMSLRESFPDLRLALVGEGVLRPRLEAMDPRGEWLRVLPAVLHHEVPAFLNKLDIFILPSKPMVAADGQVWEEQFGHVLIEAMASGVLTLGSDSGAIPEVLGDPDVTFRHGDASALAATLGFWLSHDDERGRKTASQRRQCAVRWTHEAVASTYAGFLTEPFLMDPSLPNS
jgi:glycosyltransferase involved in cell wall biosynthesis